MKKNTLTTYDIAKHCQVTPRTVIEWINAGKLKAYRTPGNHSRVLVDDFILFLKQYNIPIPETLSKGLEENTRVLIVDDDKSVVSTIVAVLIKEGGYDIETAYDGFEAGSKFAENKPHLVILDLNMPIIDGYQVCQRIRKSKQNSQVKILIVSAVATQADIERVLALGANDVLLKPFNAENLKKKIMHLCGMNYSSKSRVSYENQD